MDPDQLCTHGDAVLEVQPEANVTFCQSDKLVTGSDWRFVHLFVSVVTFSSNKCGGTGSQNNY